LDRKGRLEGNGGLACLSFTVHLKGVGSEFFVDGGVFVGKISGLV